LRAAEDHVGLAIEADVRNAVQGLMATRSRLQAAALPSRSAKSSI
jgi:hypothetical protein